MSAVRVDALATPSLSSGRRLHLGCGSTVVAGWDNIDMSLGVLLVRMPVLRRALRALRLLSNAQATAVFPEGIIRIDVRKGLPYADGSVEAIYSSHMIEHMSRWEAESLVAECRRVLAPAGILRVATPDLEVLVDDYVRASGKDATAADVLMERMLTFQDVPGHVRRLSNRLLTAPHQWLYDGHSLTRLLTDAGFQRVARRSYRQGLLPELPLLEHRPDSLIVEAVAGG